MPKIPGGNWSAPVRRYWLTWATSPQASAFTPLDWQRLAMSLPIVQLYFENPSATLMRSIRECEKTIGGTLADRSRLGWKIAGKTTEQTSAEVSPIRRAIRVVLSEEEQ